mmetsp:Transcript_26853/g.61884  ORF Transcript_26853/g.61884 Transcript_26853/m.61884 type:complete len:468 (+) Transcript_26853:24-1427(+)|eukprot:CAMPEP_0114546594 /NCGR_PEP_ID=MMETSP0114-20121206/4016_1 /TAXON_ID=31324 /ORGANISM="Goniomonas sp, Strain m" /LENGTH=467 /DNA_ID=CAMNT_0001731097 /DNA_START=23 /DNA_END=1426 /DNA_ORIENTATION=-
MKITLAAGGAFGILMVTGTVWFAFHTLPISNELHCTGDCQVGDVNSIMNTKKLMKLKNLERQECKLLQSCPVPGLQMMAETPCVDGKAGEYECKNVDLLSFTPLPVLGSADNGNDIWGWADPVSKREFAIMCCTDGTSFVEVTNPTAPMVKGFLPSAKPGFMIWRDAKVYMNHAFVVSEHEGHGMQVFDMSKLLTMENANRTDAAVTKLVADAHYDEFGSCHNIVINEESGFAYAVGSTTCKGGLHMIDITDPKNPKFSGCYADDGYTHDAECVMYHGPDSAFAGREICFAYNEDSLTVVDVTVKAKPRMLSRIMYEGSAYTHQGWLNAEQTHLLLDDELDEVENKNDGHTQTYVWDVTDLTKPRLINSYHSAVKSIDHNQYIKGDLTYQANYEAGLRILDIKNIAQGKLNEVGFFDVRPESTTVEFFGSWSVFPYLPSGNILVSSIERGLFVLNPQIPKKVDDASK